MAELIVSCRDKERRFDFTEGASLREILQTTDCRPQAGCAGHGYCGLCRVKVVAGEASNPTVQERLFLGRRLGEGLRLACQTIPLSSMTLVVENLAPAEDWRAPRPGEIYQPAGRSALGKSAAGRLGLAVDLGTTHLSLSVVELDTGQRLAARVGRNRQSNALGADIMTRLQAASDQAARARHLAMESIHAGLTDLLLAQSLTPQSIARVVVVGNPAMLSLLTGRNFEQLLRPESWSERLDYQPPSFAEWAMEWGLNPRVEFLLPKPLFGFVGSDLAAGILALDLEQTKDPCLLLDCGTNSEITLWDGKQIWVTSAAGGPAFEGTGVSCGLPGVPGAIWRLRREGQAWQGEALGGAPPSGFCGSGLIDALALLRKEGHLDEVGRFSTGVDAPGEIALESGEEWRLKSRDIDLLARAKAAVAAGLRILLHEAGVDFFELRAVHVCGTFGRQIDAANARAIGLLPDLPLERFHFPGNTALAGAEILLLKPELALPDWKWVNLLRGVNLAGHPAFSDCYLEELFLRPTRWGGRL